MSRQIFSYTNHTRLVEPEIFVSGNNDIVTSTSGSYYDLTAGLWNVNYGYNNNEFLEVLTDHSSIQFYPNHFWSSTVLAEQASEEICTKFNMSGVYFGTGGSEAIRTAIYISKFVTGKNEVLSYKDSYHGPDTDTIKCDELLDNISANTAAVLIEPIMTTSGVLKFDETTLLEIDRLRKLYNFIVVFDETVTGLGRGHLKTTILPDITIMSKGLTNGLFPFSATMVNEKIMSYIKSCNRVFEYGITMSSHPIGCKLLLKSLQLFDAGFEARTLLEKEITSKLSGLSFRNSGLLFGVDVNDGDYTRKELKKLGFITRNSKNTLIFTPMFTVNIHNYSKFFEYLQTNGLPDR